jgi:hypothetical protein
MKKKPAFRPPDHEQDREQLKKAYENYLREDGAETEHLDDKAIGKLAELAKVLDRVKKKNEGK